MHLTIFDDAYTDSFYPLTHTRSVGDLRCGILKLRQRLDYLFADADISYIIEPRLEALYSQRHPAWQINRNIKTEKLYINSRMIVNDDSINAIKALEANQALVNAEQILALRTEECLKWGFKLPAGIEILQSELPLYEHIAHIVMDNARMIEWDFARIFYEEDNFFETEPGVSVLHPYNVWISEGVSIAPNVVLDASGGPIVIDRGARIMAGSVLCGPLYIGKKSQIKIAAKIYGGVSIGPVCKVGGEVENSIFQAYSNKQHDGFLGNAYIGEWVNFGADTNNSDLKNTYKNVFYYNYRAAGNIDSGTQFMGCSIGDHTKTGINTSLNTGLVVGCGSNIYGSGLFTGFVPDFSWGLADSLTRHRFTSFCETAAIVKSRRGLSFSELEKKLYQELYGE